MNKKNDNNVTESTDNADASEPLSAEEGDKSTIPRKHSVVWIAFKSVKKKLSPTEEGATPVNWKCLFLVFISLFASSFNITFLFPFLPDMILSFGYEEVDKGYYAGIVASAMFVGRALGCYFWGWISDKKGRRPIVLVSLMLIGLSSLMFSFTTSIYFVVITRLISGLVNGMVGTAKTILYEISDNTNQAIGMSIISVSWGLGIMVGPAIGGYLANPCKQYPDLFPSEGLFYQFPYFLPGFFGFVICIFSFVIDLIWLPETMQRLQQEVDIVVEDGEVIDDKTSLHSHVSEHNKSTPYKHFPAHLREFNPRMAVSCEDLHLESEGATYLAGTGQEIQITRRGISVTDVRHDHRTTSHDKPTKQHFYIDNGTAYDKATDNDGTSKPLIGEHERNGEVTEVVKDDNDVETKSGCCQSMKNWSFVQLIREKDVLLAVMLYSMFSFSVIGVEDIFAVWVSTDIMLDGLGFSPSQIGTVLGTTSLPMLFLQLLFFPYLVKHLGVKKTLVTCTVILFIFTEAMPVLHILVNRQALLWTLLLTTSIIMKMMISAVFSATGLIINNSVEPHLAGQVNGLSMTVTAITRSIAPIFGGTIYSWTVGYAAEHIGAPFDISFVFMLFGLVYWCVAILGVTIPDSVNRQKK